MIFGHCGKCGKEMTCSCGESAKVIATLMGYAPPTADEMKLSAMQNVPSNTFEIHQAVASTKTSEAK